MDFLAHIGKEIWTIILYFCARDRDDNKNFVHSTHVDP